MLLAIPAPESTVECLAVAGTKGAVLQLDPSPQAGSVRHNLGQDLDDSEVST